MSTASIFSLLATKQIDIWRIFPNQLTAQDIDFLKSVLSAQESQHIEKYKNAQAKQIAVISRAMRRLVISQYSNLPPEAHQFSDGTHGKPQLLNNKHNIKFNLSHNEQVVVMAVCLNDEIGCDIESATRPIKVDTISKRYFHPCEHQQLQNLPVEQQQLNFFKIWTLKEAFVKATGRGISLGLDTFYFQQQDLLTINFCDSFVLSKNEHWQFNQDSFQGQLLAVCRASKQPQQIHYCDSKTLFSY